MNNQTSTRPVIITESERLAHNVKLAEWAYLKARIAILARDLNFDNPFNRGQPNKRQSATVDDNEQAC